ncbi:MAG: helicase-related protein [Thermoleophilaceae bacterium]
MAGADLRGHDGHRRADRAPRDRPLPDPDLALRPGPGRPPRRDRAAALRADPAGRGRALDLQGAAAQGRGRPGLRPGGAGRAAGPDAVQPGHRRPVQDPLQGPSGRGVHSRRATRAQRGGRLPGAGHKGVAVSGETPKRELTRTLAAYERGEIDVLCNAQLLAEGWNSPRATVCMHLAPTASRRIYQQRVGRVTRRQPGKEAGIVVDFVHPATTNDDPVVTLHSLLDRDVYRGGAIVVGPVRRGRGRRLRVERRVVPVTADEERRAQVFERELWRIAVEHLSWGEQHAWAALAGARVASNNWRRAKAMLQFDATGELRRRYLVTCLQRNRNTQLRLRALGEVGQLKDPDAFDEAVELVGGWSRDERREGVKVLLQAMAEKPLGRRDQASRWIWHLAEYSREVHEEYAVSRWPETKRLLGLLVNSSGGAHARNARRLVQASKKQDRRLSAALLAAALAHTPEAQQVLDGARMRLARKPSALARELLKNFPKGRRRRGGRRRGRGKGGGGEDAGTDADAQAPQRSGRGGKKKGQGGNDAQERDAA